jgi:hypothetical protein
MWVFEGGSIVYDEHTISSAEKALAVEVESLPEPEVREGYYAQIRANLETQELYYDYLEIPEEG